MTTPTEYTIAKNLGIGVDVPTTNVDVRQDVDGFADILIRNPSQGAEAKAGIKVSNELRSAGLYINGPGAALDPNDTNFFVDHGNLIIRMGGQEVARISESGNVAIGSTNTEEYKLYVDGDAYFTGSVNFASGDSSLLVSAPTDAALRFEETSFTSPEGRWAIVASNKEFHVRQNLSGNYDTFKTPIIIKPSNQVIIGEWAGEGGSLDVFSNGADTGAWITLKKGSADNTGPYLVLMKSRDTTPDGNATVVTGDELGGVMYQGTTGTTNRIGATIRGLVAATPTDTSLPTNLSFMTTSAGDTYPTQRLLITSTGAIGFGSSGSTGTAGQLLSSTGPGSSPTWITPTSANTASAVVIRDASGNFSAGTITAALTGNASTATALQTARTLTIGNTGKTFNGSANVSWSLTEIGAAPVGSPVFTGNVGIGISPFTKLHIGTAGSASATSVRVGNDTDASYGQIQYIGSSFATTARQNTFEILTGSTSTPIVFMPGGIEEVRIDTDGLSSITNIQAKGYAGPWATRATPATKTGAINAVMGTASGATWLLSGTSNGAFRAGIQVLDSSGTFRIYAGETNTVPVEITTSGDIRVYSTTSSNSAATGSIQTAGGMGVEGSVNVGGYILSKGITSGGQQIISENDDTGTASYASVGARNDTDKHIQLISFSSGHSTNPNLVGLYTTSGLDTVFWPAGTERARLTTAGALLLGFKSTHNSVYSGSSVSAALQVTQGSSAAVQVSRFDSANAASTPAIVLTRSRSSTVGSHTVVTNGDSVGAISFEGSDGTAYRESARILSKIDGATVSSTSMPGKLEFYTTPSASVTPTLRATITANGEALFNVASATGDAKIQVSNGVRFGGTTSSDSNTLDFYQEGTWTPSIVGSTTAGTCTYVTRYGAYTRIGNRVRFSGVVQMNTHTGTGNIRITGLPFTATSHAQVISVVVQNLTYSNTVAAVVASSSTRIDIINQVSGGGFAGIPMDDAFNVWVNGTYQVA